LDPDDAAFPEVRPGLNEVDPILRPGLREIKLW
jgi:hypothetical protein